MEAKFQFCYGAMGSGKTRDIFRVWHSKFEDEFYTIIMKPVKDKKGNNFIVSRDGGSLVVDFLIGENDNIFNIVSMYVLQYPLDTILVDEAQFLSEEHVAQLAEVVDNFNIDVICYGLLTDFQGKLFNGSKALIEQDAKLIEFKRQCKCGNKKAFNARFINGEFVFDGEQVAIDGVDASYESVCRKCYKKLIKVYNKKKNSNNS